MPDGPGKLLSYEISFRGAEVEHYRVMVVDDDGTEVDLCEWNESVTVTEKLDLETGERVTRATIPSGRTWEAVRRRPSYAEVWRDSLQAVLDKRSEEGS